MKVWILKFISTIGTILSNLVFNFHKPIPGIKSKHNIKYTKKFSIYHLLDVHYEKKADKKRPIIIYFHGGGWTCYSKTIYSTLSRRLAKMGHVVFNVNYGLAPRYKLDDILNDAAQALKFAMSNAEKYNADPKKIILAGDSAGAHIASLLSIKINSGEIDFPEARDRIKALILLYGAYNLTTMQKTGFPNIRTYAKIIVRHKGKDDKENNKFSPEVLVDENFPACFIASGEIDKLHSSQSKAFEAVLKEKGIRHKTLFFPKKELRAMHAYMIFDGLETNVITLQEIDKFLKEEGL